LEAEPCLRHRLLCWGHWLVPGQAEAHQRRQGKAEGAEEPEQTRKIAWLVAVRQEKRGIPGIAKNEAGERRNEQSQGSPGCRGASRLQEESRQEEEETHIGDRIGQMRDLVRKPEPA